MLSYIAAGSYNGNLRKDRKFENEIAQLSNIKIAQIIYAEMVP